MDAASWDERYSQADLVWTARPNVFAVDILSEVPPGDAIDLAAGEGRHAVWLATLGWNVTAVDFSAAGLTRAEQWAAAEGVAERMTTVVADVTEYQPAPSSTDLLLLAYLQLPTEQRRQAIRNTVPAVRPGGLVVVIAHDSSNLTHGTGGPPSPEMLYSPADVEKDLADCDGSWVIMRSEVAKRAVADAPRPALDAVVVALRQ